MRLLVTLTDSKIKLVHENELNKNVAFGELIRASAALKSSGPEDRSNDESVEGTLKSSIRQRLIISTDSLRSISCTTPYSINIDPGNLESYSFR